MKMSKPEPKSIIVYPSDKNGCGFYRTFIPLRYMCVKYPEYHLSEFYAYHFDLNYVRRAAYIRFQRQVTQKQKELMMQYRYQINKCGSKAKMVYELDDLVHGIAANNILAYQFYTPSRKNNLVDIFRMMDTVTFSTGFLKEYYQNNYQINNSVVIPNFLPKYLWGSCGKRDKARKDKRGRPRVLWAGSASHLGKGGDLEFLMPLIKKTLNDIQWVFFGVQPPELQGMVEFHEWANIYDYAQKLDSIDADMALAPIVDNEFNLAKSDLKILEYSALGLPTIASSIGNKRGPYDLIPGLKTLDNNADAWYSAIMEWYKNPEEAKKYLEAGQIELSKRWLENESNIGLYRKVYA
jgi:glycosyltransferase involved in cell wall biosynthesis